MSYRLPSGVVVTVADSLDTSEAKARATIEIVLEAILDDLHANGKTVIGGLGAFEVRTRPASKARNPRTGEEVQVPPRRRVCFSSTKPLNRQFN